MPWKKSPFIPNVSLVFDVLRRKRFERIKRVEEQGCTRQWFMLAGRTDQRALLDPKPSTLHKLIPPNDRIWADPFLWRRAGELFLFCEEWHYKNPHGHISVMQLSEDCSSHSESISVLKESHHLSYPFLFQHEGELYMMPEAGASGAIAVYRCEEFPHRWKKHATLMKDVCYADATLKEHGGRWWLFVTMKRGFYGVNRDLFIFSSNSPLSDQWTPHPQNPVVRSISGARPAGPLFEIGGRLYRPSQDCLVRYGYGLRINEVLRLDESNYSERLVRAVNPDWEEGIRAVHHLGWTDGMMVMDTQRLLSNSDVAH